MRPINAELMAGEALHDGVVQRRMLQAKRDVWIATANLKAMLVLWKGAYVPVVEALAELARGGVEVRLLHTNKPSRPFLTAWKQVAQRAGGRLTLRVCPRVHFKVVVVDGAWVYLGSANMTGAGLGAKNEHRRNFEMGLGTDDGDVIDHATAMFASIWDGAECAQCKLYDLCPSPLGPRAETPRRARRRKPASGVSLGQSRRLPRLMDR